MFCGRLIKWDRFEISLASACTGTHVGLGSGRYYHEASATSKYATNAIDVGLGVAISGHSDSNGSYAFRVQIPSLGVDWNDSGSVWYPTFVIAVVLENVRLYETNTPQYRLECDAIKLYRGGTYITTLATSVSLLSSANNPAWVPLIGIPVELAGTCLGSTTGLPSPLPDTREYGTTCESTVNGGWRFRETSVSDWVVDLPVKIPTLTVPSLSGCTLGVLPAGVEDGTITTAAVTAKSLGHTKREYLRTDVCNQMDVEVWCLGEMIASCRIPVIGTPPEYEIWRTTTETETKSGAITLLPNLTKSVKRNPDYRALIERGGFPGAKGTVSRTCVNGSIIQSATQETTVYPSYTNMLSTVGPDTHVIEEPFGYDTFAPFHDGLRRTKTVVHERIGGPFVISCPSDACTPHPACDEEQSVSCSLVVPEMPEDSNLNEWAGRQFPSSVESLAENPYLIPWWHHDDPVVRLIEYWSTPHAQYRPYFPKDNPETEDQGIWPLYGDRITAAYWLGHRQQWLYHPSLPSIEQRRTRTDLLSEPLAEGGLIGFWSSVYGTRTSPWGISRFEALQTECATKTLDAASEPGWALTNGTAAWGTNIVVTPAGAGDVVIEYDLGRLSEAPYWQPLSAGVITLSWVATNISAISAELVGADGEIVSLGALVSGNSYPKPAGPASKYAGSWAQYYGLPQDATDIGADLLPAGDSSAMMASAERAFAIELLPGRNAAKLRITVLPVSPGSTFTIHYPTFSKPSTSPVWLSETASQQALVWPDAHALRTGLGYFDYDSDAFIDNPSPPIVRVLYDQPSLADWPCLVREGFLGIDRESGLDAYLATIYESGVEYTMRKHFWRDPFSQAQVTHSFVIVAGGKPTGIMVHSLREVPPLSMFPSRSRDENLQPTGPFALEAWAWAVEPRYHITPGIEPMRLKVGANVWTTDTIGLSGWSITKHSHVVDNTEGTSGKIVRLDTEYASISPWHGYLGVFADVLPALGLSNTHNAFGHYIRGEVTADGVVVHRAKQPWPPYYASALAISGVWLDICLDADQTGIVWFAGVQSGNAYSAFSTDDGMTFSTPSVFLMSAKLPRIRTLGFGSILRLAFVYDSGSSGPGTLQGQLKDRKGSWVSVTVKTSTGANLSVTDAGFDFHSGGNDVVMLTCIVSGETSPSDWYSTDQGKTFTRI